VFRGIRICEAGVRPPYTEVIPWIHEKESRRNFLQLHHKHSVSRKCIDTVMQIYITVLHVCLMDVLRKLSFAQ